MLDASKTNAQITSSTKPSTRQGIKLVFLLLILAAAFVVRLQFLFMAPAADMPLVGTTANISGAVMDDPDVRTTGTRVVLGRTLVVLPPNADVSYGDTLTVRGKVEEPQVFETNTGHMFDYPTYLRVRGVATVMQRATIVEQTSGGFSFVGILYDLKHLFETSIQRVLPEPQSSLVEGMLLGDRGGFSKELLNAFVIVGLIHIVVLSGSNISIVAEAVFRLLGFLPRTLTYIVGGVVIVLFAIMTGGGAATVRAVIMAGIAILARYMRRPRAALRALSIAGVLMILWNPLVVLDSGFVLSMLATFGLITLASSIESLLTWLPKWEAFDIRSIVATTLAVEVTILPALLYFSGTLSFVSIPINALVLPFVPLIMLFGFITGLLGLLHPVVALVPALITDILVRALVFVAQTIAALPIAYATIPTVPWWTMSVYIPLLTFATFVYWRTELRQRTS